MAQTVKSVVFGFGTLRILSGADPDCSVLEKSVTFVKRTVNKRHNDRKKKKKASKLKPDSLIASLR